MSTPKQTQTSAAITVLEGQRNSALNALVNKEAALIMALARIQELEAQLQAVSPPVSGTACTTSPLPTIPTSASNG
jgi:hypothetical protein